MRFQTCAARASRSEAAPFRGRPRRRAHAGTDIGDDNDTARGRYTSPSELPHKKKKRKKKKKEKEIQPIFSNWRIVILRVRVQHSRKMGVWSPPRCCGLGYADSREHLPGEWPLLGVSWGIRRGVHAVRLIFQC